MKKSLFKAIIMICCILSLCACGKTGGETTSGTASEGAKEIKIAYQYGLAYAPLVVCQEKKMIEEAYRKATGKEVTVTWTQMSSGADINTGIAAGELSVGFMGVAPAISGVSKSVGYKIFTNLSGQEHGMMSNDGSINSLADLAGSEAQIALVNIGSIQHIILGKALSDNGYDAHLLDANIVAMKHPDGMAALESGSVACHLTSSPYIFREHENAELHEIPEINAAWPVRNSFIVGVASTELHDQDPELYAALCSAISEAIDYLNSNKEEVASMTCEYDGNSAEDELKYLEKGVYTPDTKGVYELSGFMYENGFIENAFSAYSDLVFENVKGD
ncbi:MAG: ABC transporter substrate-binding protein [Lachnospiraceae bacterium]|nr:ABC transporter substrate-binding protein [Lachnospiraceae bacterium]